MWHSGNVIDRGPSLQTLKVSQISNNIIFKIVKYSRQVKVKMESDMSMHADSVLSKLRVKIVTRNAILWHFIVNFSLEAYYSIRIERCEY